MFRPVLFNWCTDWSKFSFKFFVQELFCSIFTCVYHTYWISVHLSWNFPPGLIVNCQWAVSKLDMHIWLPHNVMEVHGKGSSFLWLHLSLSIHWLDSRHFCRLLRFEVEQVRVGWKVARGNNIHWVNSLYMFCVYHTILLLFSWWIFCCCYSRPKWHKGLSG